MRPFRSIARGVKRLFRRKRAAPRRRKAKATRANGLIHVKKVELEPRISVVGNTTAFGVDTFELADLTQFASYVSLYEEYRIDKITYSFKALNNIAPVHLTAAGYTTLGMVHSIIDTNDGTAPTSIQTMMNDSSYKGSVSSRTHTRTFKPKFLNVVGGGIANQPKTGWLSTDAQNVSHYSIKWAFEGGQVPTAGQFSFFVEPIITYYVSFRNPK